MWDLELADLTKKYMTGCDYWFCGIHFFVRNNKFGVVYLQINLLKLCKFTKFGLENWVVRLIFVWKKNCGKAWHCLSKHKHPYCIASSMNRLVSQNLCCDWLPKQARSHNLAHSGLYGVSHKKNFPEAEVINSLLTKIVLWRWLDVGLFWLWTVTPPYSINTQKKGLANTRPSWPHLVNNVNSLCFNHSIFFLR